MKMMDNNIKEILEQLKSADLQKIVPNLKKSALTQEENNRIFEKIASDLAIPKSDAMVGTFILFLRGAASSGTPSSLSVDLREGKTLAKKNILSAYMHVTGNGHIRRLAEVNRIEIGEFAEAHGIPGELSQRINTTLKAQTGEILNPKETAWCSSFSQEIPDLAIRSSERMVKLLAEDYKKRFENKKNVRKEKSLKKGAGKK